MAAPTRRHRLGELDLLRGTIMIVMAWDHCKDNIANPVPPHDPGSQMWSGTFATFDQNLGYFMARFVSHFCAPGFFWTMGVGITLFDLSRERRGWPSVRRSKHFLIRGAVLLVLARLINVASILQYIPNWDVAKAHFGGHDWSVPLLSIFEVLTQLALSLAIVGASIPVFTYMHLKVSPICGTLSWAVFWAVSLGVASFVLSNALVVYYQDKYGMFGTEFPSEPAKADNIWKLLVRFTVLPGKSSFGVIAYPLFPWIGLTLLGVAQGFHFGTKPEQASRWCGWLGLGCFLCFLFIRLIGGKVGNYRGWPRDDRGSGDFIAFFNVCKYPPSLAYCLLTMSVNLSLVRLFANYTPPEHREVQQSNQPVVDRNALIKHDELDNLEMDKMEAQLPPSSPGFVFSADAQPADFVLLPATTRPLDRLMSVLQVFGQVPLFFYMLHFFLLGTMGLVLHSFESHGLDLPWTLLFWATALVICFFACERYREFKNNTEPESLWRLL